MATGLFLILHQVDSSAGPNTRVRQRAGLLEWLVVTACALRDWSASQAGISPMECYSRCWCGKVVVKSWAHIWFDRDRWDALDLVPPTPPGMDSAEHFLQAWRESPANIDRCHVTEFHQLNMVAATFRPVTGA